MSGNGFGKEDISRTAIPACPYAKDMATINRLMTRLQTISDDKPKGKSHSNRRTRRLWKQSTRHDTKSKSLQRKPLDYLERICENGWIREAVRKIPELYPYLDHPDLWLRKGV